MDEKFWDDLIAAGAYSVAGIVAMAVGEIVPGPADAGQPARSGGGPINSATPPRWSHRTSSAW